MRGESQRFFEIFQANVYFIYEKPLTKCVNLVSGYVGWRTCLLLPGTRPLAGGLEVVHDVECLAGGGDGNFRTGAKELITQPPGEFGGTVAKGGAGGYVIPVMPVANHAL